MLGPAKKKAQASAANQPHPRKKPAAKYGRLREATRTGLEPATTGSTVRDSNQLSYRARLDRGPKRAKSPVALRMDNYSKAFAQRQGSRPLNGRAAAKSYRGRPTSGTLGTTGPAGDGRPPLRGLDL
jgi:hypothetical protein